MENTINYCRTSSFIFCNFGFWKIGNIPAFDRYTYLHLHLVLTLVSTNLRTRLLWSRQYQPLGYILCTGLIPNSIWGLYLPGAMQKSVFDHTSGSCWYECFQRGPNTQDQASMKILNIPNTRMQLVCSDPVPDQYWNIQVPSRPIVECSSCLQWLSSYIMHASNFGWNL
jgi:hypothetical protein